MFSSATRFILPFTAAESYGCHQSTVSLKLQIMHASVLSLATVLRLYLLRANIIQPESSLCSYSLIYFMLLLNRSSLPSLERNPFCTTEEPRTFTGYLCVSNDLCSIFICTVHIHEGLGSRHIACPIVSYHCSFLRQELTLIIHLYSA